jgi:hypothetical protein
LAGGIFPLFWEKENEMNEDILDDQEPNERLPIEYEPPSLIDLDDLEGVTGGQTVICLFSGSVSITSGGAEIRPKSDWNDF